jgi:membrane-associated protein
MPVLPPPYSVASSTARFAKGVHHFTTHYLSTPLGLFVAWMAAHASIAYVVLFVGGYFDALVGPSFFIPGEVIFVGGSLLAGKGVLNIFFVAFVVYLGGIFGDSSSYWIGRAIGVSLFHENKRVLTIKNYNKIKKLVDKHGPKAIFFARLVGPFSKIAPVTAGILEIPFGTFLAYNIPGVFVGIGEFLAIGYFFGDHYEQVVGSFELYLVVFFAIAAAAALGVWLYTKYRASKNPVKHGTVEETNE